MGALTIGKIDDDLKRSLRMQAASHGVSMAEEARRILRKGLAGREKSQPSLSDAVLPKSEPQWHLKASLEEILALGIKSDEPFDQKAAFDELYDYLDEE